MELSAVCVCVFDRYTIAAPARNIAYPVVDFRLGLTLAYAALIEQVIAVSFGTNCGNGGKSGGSGIGGSLKSPFDKSSEDRPVERLTS